ncbi:hypothetical protein HanIR_Chr07g0330951 [Helianthus annuus]|nr:hypothetical protein HanIR_Chr07g0330951 [Helianthus annuus]
MVLMNPLAIWEKGCRFYGGIERGCGSQTPHPKDGTWTYRSPWVRTVEEDVIDEGDRKKEVEKWDEDIV